MTADRVADRFERTFGAAPDIVVRSPAGSI
jgi:hypothetical protein